MYDSFKNKCFQHSSIIALEFWQLWNNTSGSTTQNSVLYGELNGCPVPLAVLKDNWQVGIPALDITWIEHTHIRNWKQRMKWEERRGDLSSALAARPAGNSLRIKSRAEPSGALEMQRLQLHARLVCDVISYRLIDEMALRYACRPPLWLRSTVLFCSFRSSLHCTLLLFCSVRCCAAQYCAVCCSCCLYKVWISCSSLVKCTVVQYLNS